MQGQDQGWQEEFPWTHPVERHSGKQPRRNPKETETKDDAPGGGTTEAMGDALNDLNAVHVSVSRW